MYQGWIKSKLPLRYLVFFLLTVVAGLYVAEKTKIRAKYITFAQQIDAARIMKRSLEAIKAYREANHIPLDSEVDLNETGIIGEAFSDITTTLGNIEAKRTATNPAFAALMVRFFTEAGLKPQDVVAIGASGSFPSIILATLSATKVMQLRPLLIYSIGSSMYGANIPEFTFLDMLKVVNDKGLLPYKPIAVSLGGDNDRANGLFHSNSRETFFKVARSGGIPLIYGESIDENIQKRIQLYEKLADDHPIACFVNIGGATVNYGNTTASLAIPEGLVLGKSSALDVYGQGLIFTFIKRNTPVIHLLNIRELAVKNGLPVDPIPLPGIGEGGVYYEVTYSRRIVIFFLASSCIVLLAGWLHYRMKKD